MFVVSGVIYTYGVHSFMMTDCHTSVIDYFD